MTEIDSIQMENDPNWLENGWNKTEIDKIQVENDWIEFNLGVNWSKWPQFRWGTLWTPWMQPKKLLLFQFSRVSSTNDGHSVDLVSPRPHSFNQRRQFRCYTLRVTRYALHVTRYTDKCGPSPIVFEEKEKKIYKWRRGFVYHHPISIQFQSFFNHFWLISIVIHPTWVNFVHFSDRIQSFCSQYVSFQSFLGIFHTNWANFGHYLSEFSRYQGFSINFC